jgi:hypothetical protein
MLIKLFVSDSCPKCPAAKTACEDVSGVHTFDIGDMDGLAEAAYHGVLATPTVLVLDADGREIASWRGEVPPSGDLVRLTAN